jgi:hypothetical protein
MDALAEAIRKIHALPNDPISSTLCKLLTSLDAGEDFDLARLYELNYADFDLAMRILQQWRLDAFVYEKGAVAKAATDPSLQVGAMALRYGRHDLERDIPSDHSTWSLR